MSHAEGTLMKIKNLGYIKIYMNIKFILHKSQIVNVLKTCIYKVYHNVETKMETNKCIYCNTIKTEDLFIMYGKQVGNVCKECRKLK